MECFSIFFSFTNINVIMREQSKVLVNIYYIVGCVLNFIFEIFVWRFYYAPFLYDIFVAEEFKCHSLNKIFCALL